jgi:hypothetical protein
MTRPSSSSALVMSKHARIEAVTIHRKEKPRWDPGQTLGERVG